MMAQRLGAFKIMEFPNNSINSDKFTGLFGKFLKIFEGKCGEMRPRKPVPTAGFVRRHNQARGNSATARQARDNGKCGDLRGLAYFLVRTPGSS